MTEKRKTGGLMKAARSRIGRACYFTNPENGELVVGFYKRGRKVESVTSVDRITNGFDIGTTIYTVPRTIRISFGVPRSQSKEKIDK